MDVDTLHDCIEKFNYEIQDERAISVDAITTATKSLETLIGITLRKLAQNVELFGKSASDASKGARVLIRLDQKDIGFVPVVEGAMKELKQAVASLNFKLVELYTDNDMQSVKTDGATAYLNRDMVAKIKDEFKEQVVSKMVELGYEDELVSKSVNQRTLTSFFKAREIDDAGLESESVSDRFNVEPELAEMVDVSNFFQIRIRKA